MDYKRNYVKELWINRPTVYIPEIIRFMKRYPFESGVDNLKIYIRNVLYLNWQNCIIVENWGWQGIRNDE